MIDHGQWWQWLTKCTGLESIVICCSGPTGRRFEMITILHFSGWIERLLLVAYSSILVAVFLIFETASLTEVPNSTAVVSSANNSRSPSSWTFCGMSLTKTEKRLGPNIDPCGTPKQMDFFSDLAPLRTRCIEICLLNNYKDIHAVSQRIHMLIVSSTSGHHERHYQTPFDSQWKEQQLSCHPLMLDAIFQSCGGRDLPLNSFYESPIDWSSVNCCFPDGCSVGYK